METLKNKLNHRKRTRRLRLITMLFLLFITQFCLANYGKAQDNSSRREEVRTQERAITSFEKVVISGGGNIYIHHSLVSKIILKGTRTNVVKTKAEVVSDVLYINLSDKLTESSEFDVHIYTPVIKGIQLNGGGKVQVKEGFTVVDKFGCGINGGGRINLSSLKVNSLYASINGGGDIYTQVNKFLDGEIKGGGLILYQGSPKVESNIVSGGLIKKK
jgi:hypothetical protein